MTVTIPDRIFSAGKNVWQWLPTVANPAAGPTVAEWTAGIPTQIHYEADQMKYTGSVESATAQRYSEIYATETPGQKKIEFPEVEVYFDPQGAGTAYALSDAWKAEPTGYLALRAGLDADTAAAAAQKVTMLVKVKIVDLGPKAPDPGTSGDFYRRVFKPFSQGDPIFDVAISA